MLDLKNELLKCEEDDLLALFAIAKRTYFRGNFSQFTKETEEAYLDYFKNRNNPYTYSQWVNRQIDPSILVM